MRPLLLNLEWIGGIGGANKLSFRVSGASSNLYSGPEIISVDDNGTVSVPTIRDSIVEEDEIITIEILPGTGYKVSQLRGSATLTVYDYNVVNEVSVQAHETYYYRRTICEFSN